MLSIIELLEIEQPLPPQQQYYYGYYNPQQQPKPTGFIDKIKQGYNNLNSKYEAFADGVKAAATPLMALGGSAMMMAGATNPALRTVGMGLMLGSMIPRATQAVNMGQQKYQQTRMNQMYSNQQPIQQPGVGR